MNKKLEYIKSQPDRLEKTLFEIICLMIMAVMGHGMIQGIILYGITLLSTVEFGVFCLCGAFYYLSKYKGKFNLVRLPLIIIVNAILIFFWFWLSGFLGPTAIGAAAIGIITILLAPRNLRIGLVLTTFITMIALVIIQLKTDWVRLSAGDYETLPYDFLVVLFSVLLIILYLKSAFDKERKIVLQQNQELSFLNKELAKSVYEKERIIKELKSTQRKLIESEKMASIGRITAGLAHELNNPLNFIGGNILPIKRDVDELKLKIGENLTNQNAQLFEEIYILLENIEQGSYQANSIIENLLKIDPGSKNDKEKEINLVELIKRTTNLVQKANLNVEIALVIKDDLKVVGSIIEINQVLLNILKNSIDAISGKRKPKIIIAAFKNKKNAEIQVEDNGPGIPPKIRSHIFEPFYTTKKEGSGTGLGLYISYGILKKHGGSIQLDVKYKKGAKFIIRVPLAPKS